MKQALVTGIVLVVIIGLLSVVVTGSRQKKGFQNEPAVLNDQATPVPNNETKTDILYWGSTCPHCHDTIEWLDKNQVDTKLVVIRKEVYENQTNSLDLSRKAQSCGLDDSSVGVPLMFTSEGDCLIGTPDITDYLSKKMEASL